MVGDDASLVVHLDGGRVADPANGAVFAHDPVLEGLRAPDRAHLGLVCVQVEILRLAEEDMASLEEGVDILSLLGGDAPEV